MNLFELGRWKNQICKALAKDENIINNLLPNPSDDYEIIDQLLGSKAMNLPAYILPYEFVPETQETVHTFICVEDIVPDAKSVSTLPIYVYVWVFCHKSLLDTYHRSGVVGTRTDILAHDVDMVLSGNKTFQNTIGKLELQNVSIYKPAKDYYGRVLTYTAHTFNREMGK